MVSICELLGEREGREMKESEGERLSTIHFDVYEYIVSVKS